MTSTDFHHEDGLHDPDDLKMPESPHHRRVVDAIGLAATSLLGADFDVFRDMNWYPPDGGNALAPDVMVLPGGAFKAAPDAKPGAPVKSYRQDRTGGPSPVIVVEVPLRHGHRTSLRRQAHRCRRAGCCVYIAPISGRPARLNGSIPIGRRRGVDQQTNCGELGGLQLTFHNGEIAVVLPNDVIATSDHDILAATRPSWPPPSSGRPELEQGLREAGIDPRG